MLLIEFVSTLSFERTPRPVTYGRPMRHRSSNREKRIDENHRGLRLAGKGLIVEAILVFALILAVYLYRRFG